TSSSISCSSSSATTAWRLDFLCLGLRQRRVSGTTGAALKLARPSMGAASPSTGLRRPPRPEGGALLRPLFRGSRLGACRVSGSGGASVNRGLTLGPGLEALVHPVVLLGHGVYPLLELAVHARRVGHRVRGREVFPGRR